MTRLRSYAARLDVLEARYAPRVSPPPLSACFDDYTPWPHQKALWESEARFPVAVCGVQSGKTYGAGAYGLKRIAADRESKRGWLRYWAVAPVYALTEVLTRQLVERLERGNINYKIWHQGTAVDRIVLPDHLIEIRTRSGNNPEALVSEGVDGVLLDEFFRLKPMAYRNLKTRIIRTGGWMAHFSSPLGAAWVEEDILNHTTAFGGTDPDYQFINWTTEDSAEFIPGMAELLAAEKARLPWKEYARQYLARVGLYEGQIYDEFDPAIHVADPPADATWWRVAFGKDWGIAHPGCIHVGMMDASGRWYIVDEVYANDRMDDWWVDQAKDLRDTYGAGDFWLPPEEKHLRNKFHAAGLPVRKAKNAVRAGIRTVQTLMHPVDGHGPRLFVSPKCKALIKELRSYRWDEKARDERPVKENDDAVDALRYLLHSEVGDELSREAA